MLIPPDAQMFLSMTEAALALPIVAVTSRSVASLLVNHASQEDKTPPRRWNPHQL